ncbi:phosphatase PAP2 family protein [Burkholderia stagnalis]|uniref:phosphatase PAP2 family protein n=1 Tax=Burkholderia stagnalis TaxID=1503054 RepID=UPI00075531E2|nr:phosphatase PAP2 family protein [Burkholderia stagnalis]AOK55768.1 phosphoesterase [Burkholderia stagnalis]KVC58065.1 phosphoesterase [Burkholderia stagnalis]KVN11199.1 phosphoesterase [Burkholderia stagnalis]KVN84485.1 phosphoesterase [Burkholderia stagnalis]KWI67683.1 phosphoesterase [Burkholderia stagnalis]
MFDLPSHLWISITAFGGAGLTLPLAVTIAVWLALGYSWRRAVAWLAVLAGAIGVVALTKIAFLGWGIGIRAWDFTGFSGHAMLSTSVYPVALFLMLIRTRTPVRLLGIALGLAAGIAVGVSRVALAAHSPSESVTGCIVGALAALIFIAGSWHAQPHRWSVPAVVASLVLVTVALHGISVPSHRWVTKVALQLSGHERPFVRARWKANPNYRPASQPSSLQRTDSAPPPLHA